MNALRPPTNYRFERSDGWWLAGSSKSLMSSSVGCGGTVVNKGAVVNKGCTRVNGNQCAIENCNTTC